MTESVSQIKRQKVQSAKLNMIVELDYGAAVIKDAILLSNPESIVMFYLVLPKWPLSVDIRLIVSTANVC